MNHHTATPRIDQDIIPTSDPATDAPTVEDQEWLAEQNEGWHADEPTPDEVIEDGTDYGDGEPWASWPDWTDERWTLSDEHLDELAEQAEHERRVETPFYL